MANEIIFLFGAGASRGALHIDPCDPPLGREVYDRLAECFPNEWGHDSRLGRYGNKLRENFERTMFKEVCRWEPSISILEWQRKMTLYFSRFTPKSTSNNLFTKLLEFLRDTLIISNSIFASLNYDCVFEQAAYRLGFQVDYSCNEIENNGIRILKVHGSCNFITENIQSRMPYLTNTNSQIDCGMECLQPVDVEKVLERRFSDANAFYYPVMSLYSFGRNSLVAGTRIQKIRNTWSGYVSRASLIVVIGVKPNCEDTHVWNPIKETKSANLFYIGSQEDFKIWASANSNFKFLAEEFNDGFESLLRILDSKF